MDNTQGKLERCLRFRKQLDNVPSRGQELAKILERNGILAEAARERIRLTGDARTPEQIARDEARREEAYIEVYGEPRKSVFSRWFA